LVRLGKSKSLLKLTVYEVPFPCVDIFATVAFEFIPFTTFAAALYL